MATCEGMQVSIVDGILTIKAKVVPHTSKSGKTTVLASTEGIKPVDGITYNDKGLWMTLAIGENKR